VSALPINSLAAVANPLVRTGGWATAASNRGANLSLRSNEASPTPRVNGPLGLVGMSALWVGVKSRALPAREALIEVIEDSLNLSPFSLKKHTVVAASTRRLHLLILECRALL